MSRYTLLTGATGFLGRYLLRDLLVQNERVAVLARPAQHQSVRERIETILQGWERQLQQYLPRPQYFVGDVCQDQCGLTESDCVWIRRNCRRVVHCIGQASPDESCHDSVLPQANIDSVQRMLELCRRCGIGDLHYVSTILVSGQRQGTITEDELDAGQTFDNAYHESRFHAERIVRLDSGIRRRTIYRPCVITGEWNRQFHGTGDALSASIQLQANLQDGEPEDSPASDAAANAPSTQYVAPVDWVASAVGRLLAEPEAWGRTLHVCPQEPLAQQDVVEAVRTYRQNNGGNPSVPAHVKRLAIPFQKALPVYDRQNFLQFSGNMACPKMQNGVLRHYCENLGKAASATARDDGLHIEHWSDAVVSFARADVIDALMDGFASTASRTIGLDVVGSGGGQWSLQRGPLDLLTVVPGLPTVKVPVVRMTTGELSQLLEAPCDRWSA